MGYEFRSVLAACGVFVRINLLSNGKDGYLGDGVSTRSRVLEARQVPDVITESPKNLAGTCSGAVDGVGAG